MANDEKNDRNDEMNDRLTYTGISSEIGTKLRDWAVLAGQGLLLLSGSSVLK